jgi:hypothetical protein
VCVTLTLATSIRNYKYLRNDEIFQIRMSLYAVNKTVQNVLKHSDFFTSVSLSHWAVKLLHISNIYMMARY